jgi:hypothetical protein
LLKCDVNKASERKLHFADTLDVKKRCRSAIWRSTWMPGGRWPAAFPEVAGRTDVGVDASRTVG